MSEAHHEKPFENYVVDKLVAQGWLLGDTGATIRTMPCTLKIWLPG